MYISTEYFPQFQGSEGDTLMKIGLIALMLSLSGCFDMGEE